MLDRERTYENVSIFAALLALVLLVATRMLGDQLIFSSTLRISWMVLFFASSLICLASSLIGIMRGGREAHLGVMLAGAVLAMATSIYGFVVGYGSEGAAGLFEASLVLLSQVVLALAVAFSLYRRLNLSRR